jgi:tetratricopeptide (TPR) repeat protein
MIAMDITMLLEKANQKFKIGRYEDALALYDEVLAIDNNNISALENKGKAYYYLGELNTALRFLEKALKTQMDTGILFGLSWYHWHLSLVHFDLGNLSEAKVHAEQALNLAQTTHNKWLEGVSWTQLGRIIGRTDKSQIDKAEEHILQGMKILNELKTKPLYAEGYMFLGELYADAGQKEKALENLKKVFMTSREVFVIAGSGTLALETGIANIIEPGDKVLNIVAGFLASIL